MTSDTRHRACLCTAVAAHWHTPRQPVLPPPHGLESILDAQPAHEQCRLVEVVGVNIDTQRDNAMEFIKRHSVTFPVLFDPQQSVIREFGAKAMPTSYLVNRDGVVQQVFHGYSAQKRTRIEQAITTLLATTSETAKLTVEEAR